MGPSSGGSDPLADPMCTRASISMPAYVRTDATHHTRKIVPLQCLLKQQRLYRGAVTGKWSIKTRHALHLFQKRVDRPKHDSAYRGDWVALLSAGSSNSTLKRGVKNADVTRVQRAMNAATNKRLAVSGTYNKATERAVTIYQKRVIGPSTGVVGTLTWAALHKGRH